MKPFISVVIPAYNEARRIESTLRAVSRYLSQKKWEYEIIVSDDGSCDETAPLVLALTSEANNLRLVSSGKNEGKGAAVRRGVLAAGGENIIFYDADGSTPIEELDRVFSKKFDVAVGSRRLQGANLVVRQPFWRETFGKLLGFFVRLVFPELRDIKDTQCGFKVFRCPVAHELFSASRIDGFLFDIELLLLARRRRYQIIQIPVAWKNSPESKVKILRHLGQVLRDLFRLRFGR